MKKIFSVTNDFVNSRLDRWFRRNICEVPQSLIEKNIRKGNIQVNNIKKKSSYKLNNKDQIIVYNINFSVNIHKKINKEYTATKTDLSQSSSMFIENNKNFVVINKPSGIAVQSGTKSRKNILDVLRSTKEFVGSFPYTVHRIDKETTGVLIVAKNRKYAQLFTSLFRIRKIHKTYLAIVYGKVDKSLKVMKDDLIYYENNKKFFQKAVSNIKIIKSNEGYSYLELNPITGRKHQLRKQLLKIGNPIIGDDKYYLNDRKRVKIKNLMLHAYKIKFMINNVQYNFKAKYNNQFEDFLKKNI